MCNRRKPSVRESPDAHRPGETERRHKDTDGPLDAIDLRDAECDPTKVGDHCLAADHEDVDADEEPVAVEVFKHIELVVQPSIVELVEDLHPDERVKHYGSPLKVGPI